MRAQALSARRIASTITPHATTGMAAVVIIATTTVITAATITVAMIVIVTMVGAIERC